MQKDETFLGFSENIELILFASCLLFSVFSIALNLISIGETKNKILATFAICFIISLVFFILERSSSLRKKILEILLYSFYFVLLYVISLYYDFSYELLLASYLFYSLIVLVALIRFSFPSYFHSLSVTFKSLSKTLFVKNRTRTFKKNATYKKLSRKDAIRISGDLIYSYISKEGSIEKLKIKSRKDVEKLYNVYVSEDKENFTVIFKGKENSFMILLNKTKGVHEGPIEIPSPEILSKILSKYFRTEIRIRKLSPISFGILEIGFENSSDVFYIGRLDLKSYKLFLKKAFLGYSFFSKNFSSNLILVDIERVEPFVFKILYKENEIEKFSIVDVSDPGKIVFK